MFAVDAPQGMIYPDRNKEVVMTRMTSRAILPCLIVLALAGAVVACGPTARQAGELDTLLRPYDRVYKPTGDGPFPTVLTFHGCGGAWREQEEAWAATFNRAGYAMIAVDSFSGRKVSTQAVCKGSTLWGNERAADVTVSLDRALRLPWVDPARLGLIGYSHGGWTVLDALAQPAGTLPEGLLSGDPALIDRLDFVIVFYPYCGFPALHRKGWSRPTPVLAVLAGADQTVDTAACEKVFAAQRRAGSPIDMVVIADAPHAFDRPPSPLAPASSNSYDPAKAAQSHDIVQAFLRARNAQSVRR